MEDNALIERYLSGDEEGFAMLVKKHQNHVVNIVYSLTGRTAEADDIAQDVFIKVYQNLGLFERRSGFSTWLYRITVNTTYNYLKKEKRSIPLDYVSPPAVIKKGALENLTSQERQAVIRKALEKLPFNFRTVIVLKEIEGLSYKEIAQSLGCRMGTVESRLFRAREMLKRILTPIKAEVAR